MKVKEFSNYRAPKRRPWLAIVLVAFVVLLVVWFVRRSQRGVEETTDQAGQAAGQAEPSLVADTGVPDGGTAKPPADDAKSAVPVPAEITAVVAEAERLREEDELQAARERYQRALAMAQGRRVRTRIEKALGAVHMDLLLTPRPMPEKIEYVVKRGDSLGAIAARHGTTVALLKRSNQIENANLIKVGDFLLVFTGRFEIQVNKSRRDLVVLMDGSFFKRYRVGTGQFGKTPVGTFVVREKIIEPSWWPPSGREVPFGHPDNILGTRWMSIRATGDTPDVKGYGIHGTWSPESIGHEESAGCVRMLNEDVEELYTYIPIGTPVTIQE